MGLTSSNILLIVLIALILFSVHVDAFGAGNIASISAVEGKNWRHGDIEDLLKQVSCIKHHKWSSMMIKRVYFGNWLRDYSQAMDTGALKKAQPETIRILVWLLSFLGFGYATAEFEVTSERLGVYRPEEHIDNPKNYNDDQDARPYDSRLRAPVRPIELAIDPETGMKNYIANGKGDWATSAAFVKYSFTQSIHYGRQYTSGSGRLSKGKDEDLAEACRLLGQGLHTLEDFGAHTNYVELSLIELGHRDVFPLVGTNTQINLKGKRVYPLVTGTFGMVDFYHSVIGEATDHFTQSELNEMDNAMGVAEQAATSSSPLTTLLKLLAKMPGTSGLAKEAEGLQAASFAARRELAQDRSARGMDDYSSSRAGPAELPGSSQYSTGGQNNYSQQQQGGWTGQNPGQGQNYQQPSQGWNNSSQQAPQHYGDQSSQWQQQQPPQQSWNNQGSNQWQQPPQQFDQHQQWQQQQQPPPQNQWQQPSSQSSSQPQWQQSQSQSQSQPQFQSQSQQPAGHDILANVQPTPSQPTMSQPAPGSAPLAPAGLVGMPDFDPAKTVKQIYPILAFRDKVVRSISEIIEKIPGLEALVERITETLTVFIFSLLAPFVRPVLEALQKTLQSSSEGVTESNKHHQYEVWDDTSCSDPTHSVLSKDHFSNILNEPAGQVAGEILKFIAPRVLYAWEHPEVPVDRVMQDVDNIFHHPALRDERGNECHRNMFARVKHWAEGRRDIDTLLNIQAVRQGKNHITGVNDHAGHGGNITQSAGSHKPPGTSGGYDYGAYLHSAENIVGNLTGHPQLGQHHSSQQQSQGGLGGIFQQAESFLGHGSGGGSGGHSSSSWGGGGSSSGGNSGGFGDILNIASKIPGVSQYASQINNFNKVSSFLGGRRELGGDERGLNPDDFDSQGGSSRGLGGGSGSERGFYDDGDYGDSDKYRIFQGANVGGSSELLESALRAKAQQSGARDLSGAPSPGPLPTPSGYEQYTRGGEYHGQDYGASGGGEYQQNQYGYQNQYQYDNQSQNQGYYQGSGSGGADQGYNYGAASYGGGYGSQRF